MRMVGRAALAIEAANRGVVVKDVLSILSKVSMLRERASIAATALRAYGAQS